MTKFTTRVTEPLPILLRSKKRSERNSHHALELMPVATQITMPVRAELKCAIITKYVLQLHRAHVLVARGLSRVRSVIGQGHSDFSAVCTSAHVHNTGLVLCCLQFHLANLNERIQREPTSTLELHCLQTTSPSPAVLASNED